MRQKVGVRSGELAIAFSPKKSMTIILSQCDYSQCNYWALFQDIESQTAPHNASNGDKFDSVWKYPEQLGQEYWREIHLRDRLELAIARYQLHDSVVMQLPEREHPLKYSFHLSGGDKISTILALDNILSMAVN